MMVILFDGKSSLVAYLVPNPVYTYILFLIEFFGGTNFCCILTFDPARHAIPKTRKCIFHWRGRAWLTVWDRVKIPRYTHRLMHRKRVTCELHDSYIRLMMIKHASPKTQEVAYSGLASHKNRY